MSASRSLFFDTSLTESDFFMTSLSSVHHACHVLLLPLPYKVQIHNQVETDQASTSIDYVCRSTYDISCIFAVILFTSVYI